MAITRQLPEIENGFVWHVPQSGSMIKHLVSRAWEKRHAVEEVVGIKNHFGPV
jgi:hypothetical protein